MISKKVKLRITFLFFLFLSLVLIVFLILKSLEENVVYFKSPTEIQNLSELTKKKVRIGGMVKKNSIEIMSNEINFVITDYKNEINVNTFKAKGKKCPLCWKISEIKCARQNCSLK